MDAVDSTRSPGPFLLCIVAALATGCTPFTGVATTRIAVSEAFVAQTGATVLVQRVENRAQGYGATCSRFDDPNFFLKCRYSESPLAGEIDVLRANTGEFVLAVDTTVTSLTPSSKDEVLSGAFVSDIHKDFEVWALGSIPKADVTTALRRYGELGTLDLKTGMLVEASR